ncbi:MAG: Na+/H+ antiporter subunit E [Acidobacteriota bacterium]
MNPGRPRATAFVFAGVLGCWLLWSGHFTLDHGLLMALGLLSALLVTALCRRMGIVDDEAMPLLVFARGLAFLPWLSLQITLSCLDVLRRSLSPGTRLSPEVLEVEGDQESDLGLVVYANSLTLTPGTVSIDTYEQRITVHAISRRAADDLEAGAMNRWVQWVEGRR